MFVLSDGTCTELMKFNVCTSLKRNALAVCDENNLYT